MKETELISLFYVKENAMNGRHLWMDTDASGNSCYLTDCESLVRIACSKDLNQTGVQ